MTAIKRNTKVITGLVRFSFVKVFRPEIDELTGEKKYSVLLLIPKSDKKTVKALQTAIEEAKELGKEKYWGGKIPKNLYITLRDGDDEDEEKDAPEFVNHYFITASSKTRPGVVDSQKNEIEDEEDLYSGCYGHASLNFFPYDKAGNRGIACGLNNLMKKKDGESLGGRASAEADFKDIESDNDEDDLLD